MPDCTRPAPPPTSPHSSYAPCLCLLQEASAGPSPDFSTSFLDWRGPLLDALFQVQPHQCQVEMDNSFLPPAGLTRPSIAPNIARDLPCSWGEHTTWGLTFNLAPAVSSRAWRAGLQLSPWPPDRWLQPGAKLCISPCWTWWGFF